VDRNPDRNREVEAGPGSDAPTLNISVINGSSTRKETQTAKFRIFPNPAQGKLYIEQAYPEQFSIEIYSVSGKLVTRRLGLSGSSVGIDISELPHGNYYLHLTSGDRSVVKQFIVTSPGVQ